MDGRATIQDGTYVPTRKLTRLLFLLAAWLGAQSVPAATFSISPVAISNDFRGLITLQVGGLTNGETIRVEKFIDYNGNLAVNPIDTLMQSFTLTDGRSSTIGGVTNGNRPGDINVTNGVITTRLNFERTDLHHFAGYQYLFRVTSPTGRFAATNGVLRVTNSIYPQVVTGLVKSGATNVPYAMAALLSVETGGRIIAGTFATTGGLFRLRPLPGTYQVVAANKGFVTELTNAVTFALNAGATYSNNVRITVGTRTISGKVVNASNTNQGVPGVNMFVQSSSNQIAIDFTDSNGVFSVAVTPGLWQVEPEGDALSLLGFIRPEATTIANTLTGNVSNLVLAVQTATAMVYGTLKTVSNAPLRDIEVYGDSSDHILRSQAQTDSAGNYFLGVTGTNWYLNASGDDLAPLGYLAAMGTNVNLLDGQAVQAHLVASPFAARLLGRVLDEKGAAVVNLRLNANDFTGGYSSANSGLDGSFSVGVGTGTWYLRLNDEQGRDRRYVWPELEFDITPGVNISNITFLVRSATNCIIGTVRNAQGGVVPAVEVFGYTSIGGTNYRTASSESDASGNYLLYVPDGTWNVAVNCFDLSKAYGCPDSLSVTVAVTKATADITLPPPPGPPTLVRPRRDPGGSFRFEVSGASGYRYVVEESTDLQSWNYYSSTNVYSPHFEFLTDGSQNARFYRVRRENF
jgi:hypothetical protein